MSEFAAAPRFIPLAELLAVGRDPRALVAFSRDGERDCQYQQPGHGPLSKLQHRLSRGGQERAAPHPVILACVAPG